MERNNFTALLNEASFTKEILAIGVTRLGKANYASKGIYYEAFTCLSTGLERIGKICLLLDYYIDNNGAFPDLNYLKKQIGHDIEKLYDNTLKIVKKRNIKLKFDYNLEDDIHKDILEILSNFGKGDRYSNLNFLLGHDGNNPIKMWNVCVDNKIAATCVSKKRLNKIIENADKAAEMLKNVAYVYYIGETEDKIDSIKDASARAGIQEAVAPYRQLFVLQFIRFWVEVIKELEYIARRINQEDIPFLGEIFAMFYNSDSYFKSRKTWDKL